MKVGGIICMGALLLTAAAENLRYGLVAFGATPHIDDWYFSKTLFDFLSGGRNITYLMEPHNGHLSVASHLAFLVAYAVANFDLSVVRWATMVTLLALGGFFSVIIISDIRKACHDRPVIDPLWLPTFAVPVMLIVSSKTAWEQFTVAAAINSVLCILWVSISLFLLERWLITTEKRAFIGVALCATLATLSFGTGFVVWLCLVLQLIIDPRGDKRQKHIASSIFLAACAVSALALGQTNAQVLSNFSVFKIPGYAIIVAGAPIAPFVGGQASIAIHSVLGVVLLAFSVGAVARATLSASRAQAAKYITYVFFGFANVLAIALTRQWLGLEGIAASRYAVAGMPIAIGTCGILALMALRRSYNLWIFVGFAATIVPPLLIANFEEHRMAQYRREAIVVQERALKKSDLKDMMALKRQFYVSDQFVALIEPVRDHMRRNRLSIFGQGD